MTRATRQSRAQPESRPKLQFVTTTDPSEFRNEKNRRTTRSQAMIWHRAKDGRDATAADASVIEPDSTQYNSVEMPITPPYADDGQAEQYLPFSLLDIPSQHFDVSVVQSDFQPLSYDIPHTESFDYTPMSRVTGYQANEGHERTMVQMLLEDFAQHHYQFAVGDGKTVRDVFLPTFDPSSAEYLLNVLMRVFTTSSMLHKWFPAMRNNLTLIQSAPVFASAWDDMHFSCPVDSERTAMLRHHALVSLRDRQFDPNLRFDDTTLTMMLHLMFAEFWSRHENMLQDIEADIIRIISMRGGLHSVEDRTVADFSAAYCHHSAITRETVVHAVVQDWLPPDLSKHDRAPVPESPLFCPGSDFAIINCDPCCSTATQVILRKMRDLTDLFILGMGPHADEHIKEEELDDGPHSHILNGYGSRSPEIRNQILSLPSARERGHSYSGDWVYEACRIAAIIYAEAIVELQDFSTVGDPRYAREAFWSSIQYTTCPLPTDTLVGKLYEALEHTDLDNIWGDMAGVLYWVCAVGTTAARTPFALGKVWHVVPSQGQQGDPMWVRRSLGKHAARTMCILVPQHPTPMHLTQRRLYKVQKLIGKLGRV